MNEPQGDAKRHADSESHSTENPDMDENQSNSTSYEL